MTENKTPMIGHVTPLADAPATVTVRLDEKRLARSDAARAQTRGHDGLLRPGPPAMHDLDAGEGARSWMSIPSLDPSTLRVPQDATSGVGAVFGAMPELPEPERPEQHSPIDCPTRGLVRALEKLARLAKRWRTTPPLTDGGSTATWIGALQDMERAIDELDVPGTAEQPDESDACGCEDAPARHLDDDGHLPRCAGRERQGLPDPEPAPAYEDDWDRDNRIAGTTEELAQCRRDLANAKHAIEILNQAAAGGIAGHDAHLAKIASPLRRAALMLGAEASGAPLDLAHAIEAAAGKLAEQRTAGAALTARLYELALRLGARLPKPEERYAEDAVLRIERGVVDLRHAQGKAERSRDVWRRRARKAERAVAALTEERDGLTLRLEAKVKAEMQASSTGAGPRKRRGRRSGPVLRARTLLELPTGRRRPAGKKGAKP